MTCHAIIVRTLIGFLKSEHTEFDANKQTNKELHMCLTIILMERYQHNMQSEFLLYHQHIYTQQIIHIIH